VSTFPNKSTQFRPGQSGNPSGYSRKRRVAEALAKLIDANDRRANELATIAFAKATGQKEPLEGRQPDLAWFNVLLRLLGEDGHSGAETAAAPSSIDPATAARILEAADPAGIPENL
jgi:Family of unknown function (DUF5681)